MKNVIAVSILLLLVSCLRNSVNKDSVQHINKYNGCGEEEVIDQLGKVYLRDSFPLSAALGEMRSSLQAHINKSDRDNSKVIIKELWWKQGDYYIICWFKMRGKEWIVFDAIRWRKGTQF